MSTPETVLWWHEQTSSRAKRWCRLIVEWVAFVAGLAAIGYFAFTYPRFAFLGVGIVVFSIFMAWLCVDDENSRPIP